jgi:tetratricopeptide (TPR) repeat protein
MRGALTRFRIAALALAAVCSGVPAADAPKRGGILSGPLNELEIVRKSVRDTMWDVAEQYAKRAEKERAQELDARRAQLEALAGKGDWEAVFAKAVDWNKATPHEAYRYWQAYALFRLGRAGDVDRVLDGAEFSDPVYVVLALRLKARAAEALGDRAKAGVCLKRAAEKTVDQAEKADILLEHARLLAAGGASAEALDVLKKGGALDVQGAAGDAARLYSAELQSAAGDAASAEKTLRGILAAGEGASAPVFADAACLLSQELWRRGATNEARTVAAQAVVRAPTPAMRRKAGFLLGFQEFTDAKTRAAGIARIRALVRESPDDQSSREAQLRLADSLLAAGLHRDAIEAYDLYFNLFPAAVLDPCVQESRGLALLGAGDRTGAAGVFALAAQKASTNTVVRARCFMRQADALAAEGRWGEAASAYAAAAKDLPASTARDALFREADAHDRSGTPESASSIYSRLAETPDDLGVEAAMRLASRAVSARRLPDAIAMYTSLLSATNLSAVVRSRALVGRGRAYYHSYQFDKASVDFSAAVPLAPDQADRMRFLSALCLYGERREVEAVRAARSLMEATADAALKSDIGLWLAKYDYNSGDYAAAQKAFMAYASAKKSGARAADALLWAARCALARNDFTNAVATAAESVTAAPAAESAAAARLVQAEALMELARFDDAVLMLDEALAAPHSELLARRAEMLRADALFARGADNAARYAEALAAYRAILANGATPPGFMIEAGFKAGRALEKMGGEENLAEAATLYYVNVVQAFRTFREKGKWLDEAACAFFVRAAFSLVDYKVARGDLQAAAQVLKEVVASGIPAAAEAQKRLKRLKERGNVR